MSESATERAGHSAKVDSYIGQDEVSRLGFYQLGAHLEQTLASGSRRHGGRVPDLESGPAGGRDRALQNRV